MRPPVEAAHELVRAIVPLDELEAEHRADTLRWPESTDDVFRRAKPTTPSRHLVSYVAVLDDIDGSSLLVDHIDAGRWLGPGPHRFDPHYRRFIAKVGGWHPRAHGR
jgi:8-oxo-dGTP diphosphatase